MSTFPVIVPRKEALDKAKDAKSKKMKKEEK